MLAPIRPSPMNPMRMRSVLRGLAWQGVRERAFERGEPGVGVGAEVDPQDRQVVRLDRREVAGGLGVDELAERVRPARDRRGRPGGRRSAGGTSRSAAPPLWSWPVECRKRGP